MASLNIRLKKSLSVLLAATMLVGTPVTVSAETDGGEKEESSINQSLVVGVNRDDTYANYLGRHQDAAKPNDEILIEATDYTGMGEDANGVLPEIYIADYQGEAKTMLWSNHGGTVEFEFDVAQTGLYNLEMLYYTIAGNNTVVEIALEIDGKYPFSACKTLTLDRYWQDESAILKDSRDNDIRPGQTEYDMWVTYPIKDKEGLFNEPYFFYLESGHHTLSITGIKCNIALKSMTFKNYPAVAQYSAPSQSELDSTPAIAEENFIGTHTIFIQAENNLYKTASTLYATSDRTECMVSPSHPTKQRYNTVGQETWNKAPQAITWEFNVPNDGWYTFSFKVRQNQMRGFYANRRV